MLHELQFYDSHCLFSQLLDEIYIYGTSPQYVCESYTSKKSSSSPDPPPANNADGGGSSDEEEEEDKDAPSTSYYVHAEASQGKPHTPIPLIDYIHNVVSKLFENLLLDIFNIFLLNFRGHVFRAMGVH